MYVTIRNRCGGKFVERPTDQDGKDWTVQYSITELPEGQARSIYTSIQKRRKRILYTDAAAKDKQWYRAWGGKMSHTKTATMAGRFGGQKKITKLVLKGISGNPSAEPRDNGGDWRREGEII